MVRPFDSRLIDVLSVQRHIAAGLRARCRLPRGSTPHLVPLSITGGPGGVSSRAAILRQVTRRVAKLLWLVFSQTLSLDPTFAPAAIGLARGLYLYR